MSSANAPEGTTPQCSDEVARLVAEYNRAAGQFLVDMDRMLGTNEGVPVPLDVAALFVQVMLHFRPKFIAAALAAAQVREESKHG